MSPRNLILSLAGSLVLASIARGDFSTTFSVPPYQLDATVIGIDGWEPRMPDPASTGLSARVQAIRWNNNVPALVLNQASLKNAFPATTGTKVQVTVKLAAAFPLPGAQLQQLRIIISGAPFGEIVFDPGPEGGFGFGDGGGRKTQVIVPVNQVKPNSFYTFSILVNYDAMTYDLSVTGEKKDGTPFTHEAKAVNFETKKTTMDSLLILTGRQINAYVGEISLQSQ